MTPRLALPRPGTRQCPGSVERVRLIAIFVLTYLFVVTSTLTAQSPPTVTASQADRSPIDLDGRLDDPAWQSAGVISDLTQQNPRPGEPTPYRTEVRFLVSGDTLFVGIRCDDPQPDRIAVHTMQRDGVMRGDDTVSLVFDTFGDGRSGYIFKINAAGTRKDGLISGPESLSFDWDGIWNARTQRTNDGWTAEIEIPAQSLRFTPGLEAWGLNIERFIARDRTTLRWSAPVLDATLTDLRRAGRLEGLSGLRQGRGLSISPYALVRTHQDHVEDHGFVQGDGGLDVTYNLTPELTGVLTINTDFAETEVDNRQVNLTRFALFFLEKRTFFLEGSNIFNFGVGLGSDFIPFFSRRIGLYDGAQVPILGGLKVLGRSGRWGLGVLDVVTDETDETERANLFTGRVTYDVDDHLRLGAIATSGDPDGVSDNTLVGIDAVWQTSTFHGDKNFSFGGWAALSGGDVPEGQDYGWGFKIDYPNDLWDVFLTVKEFGDALDPALGFLPRPGTRWYQGGGAYQPRPQGGFFDWVRQFYFECYMTYVEDLDGEVESWRLFTAPFNAQTESGEHLEANVVPQFERLTEPFEIVEGVVIPPGDYDFTRFRVEAQSSRHRPWRVGATVWFGDFYTGRLTQVEAFASYTTPAGHLQLRLDTENNFAHLAEGEFIQRLFLFKTVYAFTPDHVLSLFSQYDSESRNLGFNARFRWTIEPGNDLFIVWNHDWARPLDGMDPRATLIPLNDQFVVKLRWTFRP